MRLFYGVAAIALVLVWSRWGAPKSPHRLSGGYKLALELILYGGAGVAFVFLYDASIGIAFLVVAVADLVGIDCYHLEKY